MDVDDKAKRTGERTTGVFLDSGERAAERRTEQTLDHRIAENLEIGRWIDIGDEVVGRLGGSQTEHREVVGLLEGDIREDDTLLDQLVEQTRQLFG